MNLRVSFILNELLLFVGFIFQATFEVLLNSSETILPLCYALSTSKKKTDCWVYFNVVKSSAHLNNIVVYMSFSTNHESVSVITVAF